MRQVVTIKTVHAVLLMHVTYGAMINRKIHIILSIQNYYHGCCRLLITICDRAWEKGALAALYSFLLFNTTRLSYL